MDDKYYENSSTKTGLKNYDDSISKYLYDLNPKDSTTSKHIKTVLKQYAKEKNVSVDYISRWTPFFSMNDIIDEIKNDNPVEVFGNFKYESSTSSGKTGNHAIVVYELDYKDLISREFKCHLGWRWREMQKKINLLILNLLFVFCAFIFTSCDGLIKTNVIEIDTIYSNNIIRLNLSKVEWDQGSSMGGAWYKTKKNKEDTYQELANQGITKLAVYYSDYQFIQINNKGMYSLKMEYEKNYTIVDIAEMSLHRIPFPLYAIDADQKMSINSVSSSDFSNVNVDFLRTKRLINDFQNRLNVYSKIEEDENSMTLYYKDSKLILSYSDNVLNITNE